LVLSKLKLLRLEKGLTQWEVSKTLGVHRSYLSNLENNRESFTGDILQKLAAYYGVQAKDLI